MEKEITNDFSPKNEAKLKSLDYPKLPEGYKVSEETMSMVAGKLRNDFDLDCELQNMHEEWAR